MLIGSLLHVHLPNGPTAFYRISSVRLIRETHAPRRARKARRRVTDPYRELRHPASCDEPSTAASSSSAPMPAEAKSEAEDEDEDEEAVKFEPEEEEEQQQEPEESAGEDCEREATSVAEQMQVDSPDENEEKEEDTSPQLHRQQRNPVRLATGSLIRGRVFIERPELVINNMRTRLGRSLARMFAALFPADANLAARRVVAFHNQRDFVFFRHYKCYTLESIIYIESIIHLLCQSIF